MREIARTVLDAPRSGIRKIMEAAQQMQNVIHLEVGEPLFATPEHIVDAGCKALRDGYTKYTPNAGTDELRDLVAAKRTEEWGYEVRRENVIVGIGGVEVINCLFRTICDPGEEILLPDPAWPNYKTMAVIADAKAVPYHLLPENDFLPDFDELENLVNEKTKLLVINSPSNPLGVVFPEKVIQELRNFADRHGIYILSDEAYEDIYYDSKPVSPMKFGMNDNLIAAYTMSKSYAMTGWRVGYAVAPAKVIAEMTKLQEAYVSSVPGANQKAAVAALNGPEECTETMRTKYKENMQMVSEILDNAGIAYCRPGGAFYMWINIDGRDSTQFAMDFLKDCHVALSPGQTFGESGEGWIRISLASATEDLKAGVTRLAEYLNK